MAEGWTCHRMLVNLVNQWLLLGGQTMSYRVGVSTVSKDDSVSTQPGSRCIDLLHFGRPSKLPRTSSESQAVGLRAPNGRREAPLRAFLAWRCAAQRRLLLEAIRERYPKMRRKRGDRQLPGL